MYRIALLVFLLFFTACQPEKEHSVAFYYWKSNYKITPKEKALVDSLVVKNLYVRLFDVDKTAKIPQPVGMIQEFETESLKLNYVPVVFITNRTFVGLSQEHIQRLAKSVTSLINKITTQSNLTSYSEIQIDCDWTLSTKNQYFQFLEELKKESDKFISVTLRLHQVKFKEREGVPPVDKLYLMCYSTENPTDDTAKNTILDLDIAKDYLKDINDYPKSFDIALPLFSWAIVRNHLNQVKLINGLTVADLDLTKLKQLDENSFEVQEDYFLNGFYLTKGFTIKIEAISPQLLAETRRFLDKKIKRDYALIYYHLDEKFITQYSDL